MRRGTHTALTPLLVAAQMLDTAVERGVRVVSEALRLAFDLSAATKKTILADLCLTTMVR